MLSVIPMPDFYIIGAQKSGSTFIHHCLLEHPNIYLPKEEISTFQKENIENEVRKLSKRLKPYSNYKIIGIKRPDYLGISHVPQNIYKYTPNAKFIVVLRNPIERAVSAYFHLMKMGLIPIKSIKEGMRKIILGKYKNRYPRSKTIIEFSFYYKHLTNYFKYFDKKQFKIIVFEELKNRPQQTIADIYRFLEVDDTFVPKTLKKRPQKGIYSIRRLQFINLVKKCVFTYHPNSVSPVGVVKKRQNLIEKLLTYSVYGFDRFVLKYLTNNKRPELSNNLRKQLFDIYKNDIKKLEKLLKMNLDNWKLDIKN